MKPIKISLLFPYLHQKQLSSQKFTIAELFKVYEINKKLIQPIPKKNFIFDDILTKGTHFKAIQKKLGEVWPKILIIGLFVARSIYSASICS
jgi:hypothetical protein